MTQTAIARSAVCCVTDLVAVYGCACRLGA